MRNRPQEAKQTQSAWNYQNPYDLVKGDSDFEAQKDSSRGTSTALFVALLALVAVFALVVAVTATSWVGFAIGGVLLGSAVVAGGIKYGFNLSEIDSKKKPSDLHKEAEAEEDRQYSKRLTVERKREQESLTDKRRRVTEDDKDVQDLLGMRENAIIQEINHIERVHKAGSKVGLVDKDEPPSAFAARMVEHIGGVSGKYPRL